VQEFQNIGSKYNRSARPFLGSQPAAAAGPVNMQYNSPANLYSAESATDAYTAQSATLQSGMQRSVFFCLLIFFTLVVFTLICLLLLFYSALITLVLHFTIIIC